jgi:hypothetical protein
MPIVVVMAPETVVAGGRGVVGGGGEEACDGRLVAWEDKGRVGDEGVRGRRGQEGGWGIGKGGGDRYRLLSVDATAVVFCDARDPAVIEHKSRDMAMLVR